MVIKMQIKWRKLKNTSFTSITILAFEDLPDIFPHKEIQHFRVLGYASIKLWISFRTGNENKDVVFLGFQSESGGASGSELLEWKWKEEEDEEDLKGASIWERHVG